MAGKHTSGSHAAEPMAVLTERLRNRSRRVTGPRQAILEVLRNQRHPLTIKEVHRELGSESCDLATIYRSIRMLVEMDLVKRFDFGDGTARFELVGACCHEHHHHLICTGCGRIVEVEDCFPEELELEIARRNGFQEVTHRLEFFGLCPACQVA